ncbi:hypothetical protein [Paraburkholderia sp. SOS3]|uniref:hypothetical protein n=1 Tax=Paraburkholderia sp. SOS3 TaxID=1926494 RepID=UPI000947443E|nr:hypothetical protein [Paraburkholderia sp. SOS3]APR39986.1 hypothetical protein BTO02_33095 [Paraburkholderia sp. SOS3]
MGIKAQIAVLYDHEDGRYAVAPSDEAATFTIGDPKWHRAGPVTLQGFASPVVGFSEATDDPANIVAKWIKSRGTSMNGEAYAAAVELVSYALAASTQAAAADEPFQARVQPWMLECFGADIAADKLERNHRFFEEAGELVQSCGMTREEAHALVDYTWSRPVGEPVQEVGGVMVTLAALCLASGLDMHAAGEIELARISAPATMAKIRAKQAAKPKHSALPELVQKEDSDESAQLGPLDFEILLGEQMYIDSSMQYRNGTVCLTIKRKPRGAGESV